MVNSKIVSISTIFLSLFFLIGSDGFAQEDAQDFLLWRVHDLAWSPDGTMLAIGGGSELCDQVDELNGVYILDASTLEVSQFLEEPSCPTDSVAWGSDSNVLVSGGLDGFSRVWDVTSGELLDISGPRGYGTNTVDLTISPNDDYVAEMRSSGSVYFWNLTSQESDSRFDSDEIMTSFDWNPNPNLSQVAIGIVNEVLLLDSSQMIVTHTLPTVFPVGSITTLSWNNAGTILAAGGDESLHLFDLAEDNTTLIDVPENERITDITWSPDSSQIAFTSTNQEESSSAIVRIWNLQSAQESGRFEVLFPYGTIDWHPTEMRIAVIGYEPDTQFEKFQIIELTDAP